MEFTGGLFLGLLLCGIAFGSATEYIAVRKWRNPHEWFSVGFLLGVFSLIIVMRSDKDKILKKANRRKQEC